MLTEKPEHMTEEEWSAFNDDEMGEAPKAKYDNADVKLDDEVEALLNPDAEKKMEEKYGQNDDSAATIDPVNLDDIEIPEIVGADSKLEKLYGRLQIQQKSMLKQKLRNAHFKPEISYKEINRDLS